MNSPNRTRLRVAAVIGAAALAGLIGSTTATAIGGSGAMVIEGFGAHTQGVDAALWKANCDAFVAKTAEVAAAVQATANKVAADKAAAVKAAELKAEKDAAKKAKAEKIKKLKAEKLKFAQEAKEKHGPWNDRDRRHHGWAHKSGQEYDGSGHGCDGHKGDKGDTDGSKDS